MKRIVLFALVFVVVACGGGGGGSGGSGNNTPASSGEPPQPQDMQTGVFTDGPVSGLRYVQGEQEGITNSLGEFQYDANSNEPVFFYVGEILLGSAEGQAVVTPFDLSSKGRSRSLQSGFNISRFLLSLDESSDPDIQLPEISQSLAGELDFSLDVGLFEEDELASKLIELYGSGEMLSVDQVQNHLSQNENVASSIADVEAHLQSQVNSLEIVWNPELSESGVLVKATVNTGEVLIVEASLQNDDSEYLYLSRVSYFLDEQSYLAFTLNSEAEPELVSLSGDVKNFVNAGYTEVQRILRTETYTPTWFGMLVDENGYGSGKVTSHIDAARREGIQEILNYMVEGEWSDIKMLQAISHITSMLDSIMCGYENAHEVCGSSMGKAVSLALYDTEFLQATVSFVHDSLVDELCVPFYPTQNEECGQNSSLSAFNTLISGQFQSSKLTALDEVFKTKYFGAHAFEKDGDDTLYSETYICGVDFRIQPIDRSHLYIQSLGLVDGCYWVTNSCSIGSSNFPCADVDPPQNWEDKKAAIEFMLDRLYSTYSDILVYGAVDWNDYDLYKPANLEALITFDQDFDSYVYSYIDFVSPYIEENNSSELSYYLTYSSSFPGINQTASDFLSMPSFYSLLDSSYQIGGHSTFGFVLDGNVYDVFVEMEITEPE